MKVELAAIHKLKTEVENVDVGAPFILIVLVVVELQEPLETVNETVLEPVLDQEIE